jgi:radical SAM enzyme (TIGR01210 family)
MCNYGAGPPVTAKEMVDFARRGLLSEHLDERTMVLVSPSGSMFDPWEVPVKARESIFNLVRETPCWCYHCETRAETLTEDGVRRCAEILAGKEVCIELGLESADPWVLKYCINKGLSLDTYRQGVALLRKHHLVPLANVIVGVTFLSPREAVEDAVRAVRWALANGVERCVVFPVHVKRYTLAEWLWQRGLYAPPSLWSLVEVLATLGRELSNRVTISWYKAYFGEYAGRDQSLGKVMLSSPTTCPDCLPTVMGILDAYRDTRDFELVTQLVNLDCRCKRQWRASLESQEQTELQDRVARHYEAIGQGIFGQDRRNAGDGVA